MAKAFRLASPICRPRGQALWSEGCGAWPEACMTAAWVGYSWLPKKSSGNSATLDGPENPDPRVHLCRRIAVAEALGVQRLPGSENTDEHSSAPGRALRYSGGHPPPAGHADDPHDLPVFVGAKNVGENLWISAGGRAVRHQTSRVLKSLV